MLTDLTVKSDLVLTNPIGKVLERVLLGGMSKNEQIQFFYLQIIYAFTSNLNIINVKLFYNHCGLYRFRKKFKKDSGEINPLEVHRNTKRCILEVNCEGLGW